MEGGHEIDPQRGPGLTRIVIIGGGHNGLVTAGYLARAGHRPIVLERRPRVGGTIVTEELHPGFRCPTLIHALPRIHPELLHYLDLKRHGLTVIEPDPAVFAPAPGGQVAVFYRDAARTAEALAALSKADAAAYPRFVETLSRIGEALDGLLWSAPLPVSQVHAADLWRLIRAARRVRHLGERDVYRLLRYAPMPVADVAGEWFDTDLVRAVVAAQAVHTTSAGPWSPGTGALLLLRTALSGMPIVGTMTALGGCGSFTGALASAATAAGAEIRTGAEVAAITIDDGRVAGVRLAEGEEIPANVVISAVDPKRTLLGLVDPSNFEPGFAGRIGRLRAAGSVAKVNLALSDLPSCPAAARLSPGDGGRSLLRGQIHIGPGIDHLEQAFDASKYRQPSDRPYLDVTIPTLVDPSLAPPGCHVMSIHAQFMPYRVDGGWKDRHEQLTRSVIDALTPYFPNLDRLVVHGEVFTPLDVEKVFGLTGGHLLHIEPALDQLFGMRPVMGWERYRMPIDGLYLCGSGTHPGVAVCGASGVNAARRVIRDLRRRKP